MLAASPLTSNCRVIIYLEIIWEIIYAFSFVLERVNKFCYLLHTVINTCYDFVFSYWLFHWTYSNLQQFLCCHCRSFVDSLANSLNSFVEELVFNFRIFNCLNNSLLMVPSSNFLLSLLFCLNVIIITIFESSKTLVF